MNHMIMIKNTMSFDLITFRHHQKQMKTGYNGIYLDFVRHWSGTY